MTFFNLQNCFMDIASVIIFILVNALGPISRKPGKLFGPLALEPFLVHLYLKTEKCIQLFQKRLLL